MNRFKGGIHLSNHVNFNIEMIIDEYSNYVFKIINSIVGTSLPYQDKEEIASDVFYLLWKNQENINTDLKSYISVIARNCSYSKLRKKKINFELKEELISNDSEFDHQSTSEQLFTIRQKLNDLKEEEKEIFYFYYVYGYKIKEIAKQLKLNSGVIKIRLYRIRKKLREG